MSLELKAEYVKRGLWYVGKNDNGDEHSNGG